MQLTDGERPGPDPSGGHEHHQGLAAPRLTFDFQRGDLRLGLHLFSALSFGGGQDNLMGRLSLQ
ncbi:MAG: hypothetical protein EBT06_00755 [Gammaproteobacteria bacterium]|nr:hypothetical protein [Gammaproteobacteria bacterium]NBY23885.1 hypothetical protein [Gammaproteobacteria bacterium]NDE35030.1 hypothetical protein [Gammaproteobacteria bacterium]NDE55890.1 hypothetical protein [Gammaproteobacteria bacterium]NDG88217.1 hypothetical protein [Gammaproteobacteria bacterium]